MSATQLLNEGQVAEITGLNVRTLRNWRLFGKGPVFLRISRKAVRYHVNDVEAWIKALPSIGGESHRGVVSK